MTETLDEFYGRSYWSDNVLVWPSAATKNLITGDKKLLPKRWTREQAKQYVNYLKNEVIEI